MSRFIKTTRNGHVLEIVLDRPKANAITPEVGAELHRAFCELRDDSELRAAILTGAGERIFCAGWDLKEVALHDDPGEANDATMNAPGGFAGFTEMWDIHKPIIVAINGSAVGGGFEMALAADIVLAVPEAEFALPEMQRGFVPDAGAIQRLPRKFPYNIAVELMLTGRKMSAREAAQWGFVNAVVARDELMPRARAFANALAGGAPLAVRALLEAVSATIDLPLPEAFAKLKHGRSSLQHYERMMRSEDFLEGPRAFAEKREPIWKGR